MENRQKCYTIDKLCSPTDHMTLWSSEGMAGFLDNAGWGTTRRLLITLQNRPSILTRTDITLTGGVWYRYEWRRMMGRRAFQPQVPRDFMGFRRTFWMTSSGQHKRYKITGFQRNLEENISNVFASTVPADGQLCEMASAGTVMAKPVFCI